MKGDVASPNVTSPSTPSDKNKSKTAVAKVKETTKYPGSPSKTTSTPQQQDINQTANNNSNNYTAQQLQEMQGNLPQQLQSMIEQQKQDGITISPELLLTLLQMTNGLGAQQQYLQQQQQLYQQQQASGLLPVPNFFQNQNQQQQQQYLFFLPPSQTLPPRAQVRQVAPNRKHHPLCAQ